MANVIWESQEETQRPRALSDSRKSFFRECVMKAKQIANRPKVRNVKLIERKRFFVELVIGEYK